MKLCDTCEVKWRFKCAGSARTKQKCFTIQWQPVLQNMLSMCVFKHWNQNTSLTCCHTPLRKAHHVIITCDFFVAMQNHKSDQEYKSSIRYHDFKSRWTTCVAVPSWIAMIRFEKVRSTREKLRVGVPSWFAYVPNVISLFISYS